LIISVNSIALIAGFQTELNGTITAASDLTTYALIIWVTITVIAFLFAFDLSITAAYAAGSQAASAGAKETIQTIGVSDTSNRWIIDWSEYLLAADNCPTDSYQQPAQLTRAHSRSLHC